MQTDAKDLAEAVRRAVLDALMDAYDDAGVRGLCAEGRFEAAVGAARALDLAEVTRAFDLAASRSTEET